MDLLKDIPENKIPSIIQDPFTKNKITSVMIYGFSSWDNKWDYSGTVEFKNGDTRGKQEIKGSSMDDVYLKTANFIKSLE